ncbi:MAG: prephenate dehydrogenase/arogenate dehydrogenase family protein [Candidatus Omnitrophica bacterium]|nr:prephenate dehydrogenase/arogenate dehydrogenase family protein [Candidatus Omnitrophota bacterium]
MAQKKQTFVIIGLGLIGGSLAGAIRKHFRAARVIAVSRSSQKIAFAKKKRLIHEGFTALRSALSEADLVFVCSPVDSIPKLISEVDRYAPKGTVVSDVGSTKGEIVRWSDRRRFRHIEFVGSHPLAGSHLRGLRHVKADLFEKAFVFVTPSRKTARRAASVVSRFWKRLRASVQVLSPEAHDELVSEVSHLPHAVASALVNQTSVKSLQFASSGFLDTTRVAQGDPALWVPIFLTNRAHLLARLKRLEGELKRLTSALKRRSGSSIRNFLKTASTKRSRL